MKNAIFLLTQKKHIHKLFYTLKEMENMGQGNQERTK